MHLLVCVYYHLAMNMDVRKTWTEALNNVKNA